MKNTLAICLVVKNEEKNLEELLPSLTKFADEILIGDTGSSDDSVNVAKEYADVFMNLNGKSVTESRNILLKCAASEWILSLDADERILEKDMEKLIKILGDLKEEAYRIPIFNYLGKEKWSVSCVIRLVRKSEHLAWERAMHESLSNSFVGKTIGFLDNFVIHHFSSFSEKKKDIYTKTMKRYIQIQDKDMHALEHYACEIYTNGEYELGKQILQEIIVKEPQFQRAHKDLAYMYLNAGEFEKAEQEFKNAINCDGEKTCMLSALYCGLSQVSYAQKDYKRALKILLEGIDNSDGVKSHLYFNTAKVEFELGDRKRYFFYRDKAIEENPYLLTDRVNRESKLYNTIYQLDCIIF